MSSVLFCVVFSIIALASIGANSAITKAGCSENVCVQFKNGRACYYDPTTRFTRATMCLNPHLAALLDQHITSPPQNASTVAYYTLRDKSFLGGADLQLDRYTSALANNDIAICFTGGADADGNFVSTCSVARGDDDHIDRGVASAQCGRLHTFGAGVVQEGCSTPPLYGWEDYLWAYPLRYLPL